MIRAKSMELVRGDRDRARAPRDGGEPGASASRRSVGTVAGVRAWRARKPTRRAPRGARAPPIGP